MKRALSIIVAAACLIAGGVAAFANANTARQNALNFIRNNVPAPTVSSVGGEWAVLALARGGVNVPAGYYDAYINRVRDVLRRNNGNLPGMRTEFARVVLALTALGVDVTNIDGHNLIAPLEDFSAVTTQGTNGAIFALLALDSNGWGNMEIRQQYINFLVGREIAGGGFALGANPTIPAADVTGMALTALAPYAAQTSVASVITRGLAVLENITLPTAEHAAWAVIARQRHGASVDATLAALLPLQQPDGSFRHTAQGGGNVQMATEQAALALIALNIDLFDMSDVPIRDLPELPPPPPRPNFGQGLWAFIVLVFNLIVEFFTILGGLFS